GMNNGLDREGKALIYVEGPNQYRYEDSWPIPDAHRVTLHLRPLKSRTIASLNDGTLSDVPADPGDAPAGYDYSPTGAKTNNGGGGPRPTGDQRADEKISLTWTSSVV